MAFHATARRWAENAVASGMLTVAELRSRDPAACTLFSGGTSRGQVSEPRSPAAVAPAARCGELAITVVLDQMTAMQLREMTWGDPHHPAAPEELAVATAAFLRRAIRT
jgi:hypothetical protein